MAAETVDTKKVLPQGRETQELARVRRELDEVRQRLEEETAYYRAELEASQRRQDRDSTRLQADEVARRRRAEEQLSAAQAELRQARIELNELSQQHEELQLAMAAREAEQTNREQSLLEGERQAAREAWREAERETALQERELEALRRMLVEEQQARQQAVALAAQWEQEALQAQQAKQDASNLVVSLKKALWNTAHARRHAETALLELRAAGKVQPTEPAEPKVPQFENEGIPHTREDGYNEVSQEALKTVFFGDVSENLSDEFRLTTADASLDHETVGQLRAATAPPGPVASGVETAAATASKPVAAVPSLSTPSPLPGPASAAPLLAADKKRHSLWRLLLLLSLAAALTAAGYWLLADGGLDKVLRVMSFA